MTLQKEHVTNLFTRNLLKPILIWLSVNTEKYKGINVEKFKLLKRSYFEILGEEAAYREDC